MAAVTLNHQKSSLPSATEESSLPYLPALLHIRANLSLYVDILSSNHFAEAYRLVQAAALRGDNIGLDEFPTAESFLEVLEAGDSYMALDSATGRLVALIVIAPCNYSRSVDPIYADGYIVLAEDLQQLDIFRQLLRLSLRMTLDLEYEGCLVNTFVNHTNSILALRAEGFLPMGCIPMSGFIHKQGWTESMILFKDLKQACPSVSLLPAGKLRLQPVFASMTSHPELQAALEKAQRAIKSPQLKTRLDYFPLTLKVGERTLELDYVKGEAECRQLMDMYNAAAQKGQGYGEDEFASLEVFKSEFVDRCHAIIGRDVTTRQILLSFSISPTCYGRSANPFMADGFILVDPQLRGRGVGMHTVQLMLRLAKDIGYKGCVTDTSLTNIPMYRIMMLTGFCPVGYAPKSVHVKGAGWIDVFIMYRDLTDNLSTMAKL